MLFINHCAPNGVAARPVMKNGLLDWMGLGKRPALPGQNQGGPERRKRMNQKEVLKRYADRVGYDANDLALFKPGDPRVRQLENLAKAAPLYSIVAEVAEARHCNSGYQLGDKFVLDVDGNFIAKLCPKRLCVYLVGQMQIPVALINERLSEELEPNAFHFMHRVNCPDVGINCGGYGQVTLQVEVKPRG